MTLIIQDGMNRSLPPSDEHASSSGTVAGSNIDPLLEEKEPDVTVEPGITEEVQAALGFDDAEEKESLQISNIELHIWAIFNLVINLKKSVWVEIWGA